MLGGQKILGLSNSIIVENETRNWVLIDWQIRHGHIEYKFKKQEELTTIKVKIPNFQSQLIPIIIGLIGRIF